MKKKYILSLASLLILSGFLIIDHSKTKQKPSKKIVVQHGFLAHFSKNDLVNNATAIISGTVISSEVQNDFLGLPATDFKIKVNKVFRGEVNDEIEVRTVGGETDDTIHIADKQAVTFEIGEDVTLFLIDEKGVRPDKDDFDYFVLGQHQGKFKKKEGKIKSKRDTFSEKDFLKELGKIEKENAKNKLPKLYVKPGEGDNI
ncbi:MAG: hypothetical protein N4A62_05365 [Marinisporobacter sp.]|jgi:molybdopterin-binding protein|nr:hypothetical protein [Marinisporobacter sp.]